MPHDGWKRDRDDQRAKRAFAKDAIDTENSQMARTESFFVPAGVDAFVKTELGFELQQTTVNQLFDRSYGQDEKRFWYFLTRDGRTIAVHDKNVRWTHSDLPDR